MRLHPLLATLCLGFFLFAVPIADANHQDGSPPVGMPPLPREGSADNAYWGTVTELTKTSISIQFDHQPDQTPKTFPVSETLRAGKYPVEKRMMPGQQTVRTLTPAHMYRLIDVKAGDWVSISYSRLDGLDTCETISIRRRPGGRVPPVPEGAEPLTTPFGRPRILYHEMRNAYRDLEEKGIPYPEKFGRNRRWPIAPMPRALGADISQ